MSDIQDKASPGNPPLGGRALDLVAVGRVSVDLCGEQIGGRLEETASFAKAVGGRPAAVAVGVARLGLRTAVIGCVGDDPMGRYARETLAAEGVDLRGLHVDPDRNTGLTLRGLSDRQTFSFMTYGADSADWAVERSDVDPDLVASASVLLVTGTHLSSDRAAPASFAAIDYARSAGTKVVLDIDYRADLWRRAGNGGSSAAVTPTLLDALAGCDMIYGDDSEFCMIGDAVDLATALANLRRRTPAILVVRLEGKGAVVIPGAVPKVVTGDGAIYTEGYPVETIDALGAAEGFLCGLLRGWLGGRSWQESARLGSACWALAISRRGCTTALPSWPEVQDFLSRGGRVEAPLKLHADSRTREIHRATTGRRKWSRVLALTFDNRRQFEELAARHNVGAGHISRFKLLVAEAFRREAPSIEGAGFVVDDRYGRDSLDSLTGKGFWVARPVERSGATPVAFEHGPDIVSTLRSWPVEQIAKVLVYYRPDDPPALRALQEERTAAIYRACVATGREMLVELIPAGVPVAGMGDAVAASIESFYAAGIRPEWWSLPHVVGLSDWRHIGSTIRVNDPYCRGILILGQEVLADGMIPVLEAATGEPLVQGFAVGRSLMWQAAESWFAGKLSDAGATQEVAGNYRHMVSIWERFRGKGS